MGSSDPSRLHMMESTTQTLLVVAVAVVVVYLSWTWFKKPRLNLPPGPTALPFIGSLHLLGAHPHRSLQELSRKYGPVMSVRFGQRYCIVASTPEAAKEFLRRQDANFCHRPYLRAAELIMPGDMVMHSLTPENKHLKKLLVAELTSAKRLESAKDQRTEEMAYMLRAIFRETGAFEFVTYTNILSANLLTRMVLNRRLMGSEDRNGQPASAQMVVEMKEFTELVAEMIECFSAVHPQDFFNVPEWFDPQGLDARFLKAKERLKVFYANMIRQHEEFRRTNPITEEGQQTLFDVLLAQFQNPDFDYTEDHIRSFIWDALAAGTDPLALTTEWALAEVLRNPSVYKQVRAEVDRVVGLERTVLESDIPKLDYIQAVLKESLRLHPPVPFLIPHQCNDATTAFGYDIPAKTRLFVNLWAIQRDPETWEKPTEFVPERFLSRGAHEETHFQGHHFELLPFGSGRRACPGMPFASTSVLLQVASLVHAFDFTFPDGMAPEDLDMAEVQGLTLGKRDRLVLVAKPRLPSHLY